MSILEWQERFNLGIEQFDVHHRHLVFLLNSTYDNLVNKLPVEDLGLVLDELFNYALYHFNAEERWMEINRYPKFDEHREMHNQFKKRLLKIQIDFLNKCSDIPLETLTLLASWLSEHILVADADFHGFHPCESQGKVQKE